MEMLKQVQHDESGHVIARSPQLDWGSNPEKNNKNYTKLTIPKYIMFGFPKGSNN